MSGACAGPGVRSCEPMRRNPAKPLVCCGVAKGPSRIGRRRRSFERTMLESEPCLLCRTAIGKGRQFVREKFLSFRKVWNMMRTNIGKQLRALSCRLCTYRLHKRALCV